MGISVTYPVNLQGSKAMSRCEGPQQSHHQENHKPQTVEEIAHQLAGAMVFTKADALKAFLQVHLTKESSKLLVINTHKQVQVQENALRGKNVTGYLPDEDRPHHGEVPRSDKHPR